MSVVVANVAIEGNEPPVVHRAEGREGVRRAASGKDGEEGGV